MFRKIGLAGFLLTGFYGVQASNLISMVKIKKAKLALTENDSRSFNWHARNLENEIKRTGNTSTYFHPALRSELTCGRCCQMMETSPTDYVRNFAEGLRLELAIMDAEDINYSIQPTKTNSMDRFVDKNKNN